MVGPLNCKPGSPDPRRGPTRRTAVGLILGAPLLGACSACSQISNPFAVRPSPSGPAGPQQQPLAVGTGQVKVGLILPLSAAGNAGVAAQSMKNAAEMALAEFQNPNIQLLIKDDGGSPQGAQQVAQQALDEGAEIILGPLFAASVPATAQLDARARHLGDRVLDRFQRRRPRRLSAELPARSPTSTGSSIIPPASESDPSPRCCPTMPMAMWWRRPSSRRSAARAAASSRSRNMAPIAPTAARTVAQSLGSADALFIADDGDSVVAAADALTAAGANLRNIQLLGTGLWDNPRVLRARRCRAASMPRRIRPAFALLRPLSHQIRRRAGPHRDARL